MKTEVKNYADSLFEKALMDSVKQLQEERANYLTQTAQRRVASSLLSGPEIQALAMQHVRHVERSMAARLESYQQAFTEANQIPSDQDLATILSEAQRVREQQAKNSAASVRNFIASRGSSHLPPEAMASSINQIMNDSGHGRDRVLREWKIWRDKTRLSKPAASSLSGSAHDSLVAMNLARGHGMKSAFISYSWDDDPHREWVRRLAERLRADGGMSQSIDGRQSPGINSLQSWRGPSATTNLL